MFGTEKTNLTKDEKVDIFFKISMKIIFYTLCLILFYFEYYAILALFFIFEISIDFGAETRKLIQLIKNVKIDK